MPSNRAYKQCLSSLPLLKLIDQGDTQRCWYSRTFCSGNTLRQLNSSEASNLVNFRILLLWKKKRFCASWWQGENLIFFMKFSRPLLPTVTWAFFVSESPAIPHYLLFDLMWYILDNFLTGTTRQLVLIFVLRRRESSALVDQLRNGIMRYLRTPIPTIPASNSMWTFRWIGREGR